MDLDFLGYNNYDNSQVNSGNESGARFAVPIQIKMKKHLLTISPYYEVIDFGKINNIRVTSGAVATTVIYKPQSETRNIGVT